MIAARKSALFSRWFAFVARRRIMRAFESVRVHRLDDVRLLATKSPVLVVSNHTAWWDALLVVDLCVRELRVDAYAMMDASHLESLPFFGLVGAFGVDLDDPADGARAIRYAAKLLTRPGRLVWVFPQGREVPVTAPVLGFRAGSAEIARLARRAVVVPAAIRYEYGAQPKASIYVSFGEPLPVAPDAKTALAGQETAVERELERIDTALVSAAGETFAPIYDGPRNRASALASRMLAVLARPRRRLH